MKFWLLFFENPKIEKKIFFGNFLEISKKIVTLMQIFEFSSVLAVNFRNFLINRNIKSRNVKASDTEFWGIRGTPF